MPDPNKKVKMGRPPKDPQDKRGMSRTAMFTIDEYAKFKHSTGTLRVSDSGFLRAAALMTLSQLERGEIDLDEFYEIADDS